MAWAHVSSGAVANGTTSVAPTFGAATLATDFLSAVVAANGATAVITCSDGTWTKIGEANAGAGAARVAIFVKPNCGAGEAAPTFSATGAGNMHAILREHSGGPTTAAGITFKTATGTAATLTATLTAADAAAGNLLLSGGFNRPTTIGTVTTADSYNNGATPTGNENNDASSTFHHYRFAWGVTTGNGSADSDATSGWSIAGGSNTALILVSVPSAAVNGNASGSIPTLTLSAPAAAGTGDASGTGAPGTLTLSAPAATGAGGSLGSGSIGTLTLSAPGGTARGGASAAGALGTLVLSAITGSAAVSGALVGGGVIVGRIARRVAGHAVRGLAGHAATRIAGHAARALAGRIPRRTP